MTRVVLTARLYRAGHCYAETRWYGDDAGIISKRTSATWAD